MSWAPWVRGNNNNEKDKHGKKAWEDIEEEIKRWEGYAREGWRGIDGERLVTCLVCSYVYISGKIFYNIFIIKMLWNLIFRFVDLYLLSD